MSTWTEVDNERRIDLLDKDIAGDLIPSEGRELNELSERFREYLKAAAPLPIVEATELHDRLKVNEQTERECFEAEAEEHGFPLTRDHSDDGVEPYLNEQTDAGWLFWQSRAALDNGTMPPLVTVPEFPVVNNPSGEGQT